MQVIWKAAKKVLKDAKAAAALEKKLKDREARKAAKAAKAAAALEKKLKDREARKAAKAAKAAAQFKEMLLKGKQLRRAFTTWRKAIKAAALEKQLKDREELLRKREERLKSEFLKKERKAPAKKRKQPTQKREAPIKRPRLCKSEREAAKQEALEKAEAYAVKECGKPFDELFPCQQKSILGHFERKALKEMKAKRSVGPPLGPA